MNVNIKINDTENLVLNGSPEWIAEHIREIYNALIELDRLDSERANTHYDRNTLRNVRQMYYKQMRDLLKHDNSNEIPF